VRRIIRNKFQKPSPDLSATEAYLHETLRPVQPRPAFVSDLKLRLARAPQPKSARSLILKYSFWGAAGLISGAIIIIAGVRATILILSALGVLHFAHDQVKNKSASSMKTAI